MLASKSYGIGLIELMLVLSIAAIMSVAGLRLYRSYLWQKDITVIQQSVALLHQGAIVYCDQHRQELGGGITLSVADLVDENILHSHSLIKNPWGDDFVVQIVKRHLADNSRYLIKVEAPSITKITPAKLAAVRANLFADPDDDNHPKLSWTFLPHIGVE